MARPRVFISSTYYDLRQIREDIERFILELGYEPIRHETGAIPYAKEQALEYSAYQEVEQSHIIINIIGGRYGTESSDASGKSISQTELAKALEKGVQVFIFVQHNVLSELDTYRRNKGKKDIDYCHVDNIRVFEFLDELYQLPANNPIQGFHTAKDITDFLRAQWAGLFTHFLRQQARIAENRVLDDMKTVASTLQTLVTFLTEEREDHDKAIKSILFANHPAFRRFANVTGTPYRVYFTNRSELESWLLARGWRQPEQGWSVDEESVYEYCAKEHYLKITYDIFDEDGNLKVFNERNWNDEWIQVVKLPLPRDPDLDAEPDDIPF